MTKKRLPLLIIFNFLVVAIVAALFIWQNSSPSISPTATPAEDLDGINDLAEPLPISDFTLTNQNGEEVQLSDFEGKLVLLYFGFTNCPDFCPATMGDYKLIKQDLGDAADDVVFLFVSVDPERDTPEVLDRYVSRFDPSFVGATASEETLTELTSEFSTTFSHDHHEEGEAYAVQHSTSKFLLNQSGDLMTIYSFGVPFDEIALDLLAKLST